MPIRIVLADKNRIVLTALGFLLTHALDLEVLASCQDGEETLQALGQIRPDILILDIDMPHKDGLAVLRELHRVKSPTRSIILTADINSDNLLEAMRLGVGAVILKEMPASSLIECVRSISTGRPWLGSHSIGWALEKTLRREVDTGKRKPAQIFLCHASEDKAAVVAIYDQLKTMGYKPWLDKKDLLPGQRWRVEIPKAIRASDFVVIFLSKTSVAKRGYVQKEFKLALEVLDEMPEDAIYLIPVRLDDCPIPRLFAELQWCNLYEDGGFSTLLRSLPVPVGPDTH
jgi:DNA-binding NarL/FixJ family response regulator